MKTLNPPVSNDEFLNCPFEISLATEDLEKLDVPFTDETSIVIMDTRATSLNYYWNGWKESELEKFNSQILVNKVGNKCITLRQILNTMIKSKYYHTLSVMQEPHCFLEDIIQKMIFNMKRVLVVNMLSLRTIIKKS